MGVLGGGGCELVLVGLEDVELGGGVDGGVVPAVVGLLEGLDDLEGEVVDPVEALSPEARMVFEEARLEARRLTTIRYVV